MPVTNIKNSHINKWLLPLSWMYGLIVFIRNKLFDWKILKQKEYPVPVICIGNITVGGTGKTPHTEYLISLLKTNYKVAVLSRGYKRKSSGYILATPDSTASQIGDEPYQIKNKYPDILVAVDSKRQRGIENLLSLPDNEKPDVILLDDAFQHRYVKPSFTVLLTDFNRLMTHDALLPAGRLREPAHYAEKADIVIITKCPTSTKPLDQRILSKDLHLYPYQNLFFTSFQYGLLSPVFNTDKPKLSLNEISNKDVLIVAGIANPKPFERKIRRHAKKAEKMLFSDHYQFSDKDITSIEEKVNSLGKREKMIITTEKDAARLKSFVNLDKSFKEMLYYLPIEVIFVNEHDKEIFNNKITEHVRENTRNGQLHQK
ncbi:tetraacyldisaccharide 4'-kinase [Dysgonomonas capnocytophagoides]|uniref:Tetraacyldisaccharide 4'-kinase n=1 Tax=Dysgonomonas capnocytophagoides TaxID=45254 RepID=A0A4Y8L631_9BACT|nr:tetraacyldisaccharide 4'-kinase [Dysgonomonas capnocytophagoides]